MWLGGYHVPNEMDQQQVRDILSGTKRGVGARVLRGALGAASFPYACAMHVRRWAYGRGLCGARSVSVPVICIGNITTGGTGKTPMVAWVVRQLKDAAKHPTVLTRGYKSVGGKSDEAELLKRLCNVPVIVNPDRVAGARETIIGGADVCVMDDGFQHLRIRRDLDIVLIDAANPFGYGWCLPRGLLREPLSALRNADAIVITRSDSVDAGDLERLQDRLSVLTTGASIHQGVHRPTKVIDENGDELSLDVLTGKNICAFCGIANPDSFFALLEQLGAELVNRCAYDDHVEYTASVTDDLRRLTGKAEIDAYVTTQKDLVKLSVRSLGKPVWTLAAEMEIVGGEAELSERILSVADSG